jgi:hypothetical protein
MKKLTLLFLLFYGTASSIFGQFLEDKRIEIFASASINGTEYYIRIIQQVDNVKVKFKIRDSTSIKLDNDIAYNAHINSLLSLKDIDLKNDTVLKHLSILKSIN